VTPAREGRGRVWPRSIELACLTELGNASRAFLTTSKWAQAVDPVPTEPKDRLRGSETPAK
jgi:hypothetical protein